MTDNVGVSRQLHFAHGQDRALRSQRQYRIGLTEILLGGSGVAISALVLASLTPAAMVVAYAASLGLLIDGVMRADLATCS